MRKTIRPDILLDVQRAHGMERIVLDTKWKIPGGDQPADEDLKQMYAYNLHFGARRSVLINPRAHAGQAESHNAYAHSVSLPADHSHVCGTHFVELFDADQKLRKDIGTQLLSHIVASPVY